jgi:hypothetical protein
MADKTLKLENPKFDSFYKANPKFDILTYNFFDQPGVKKLKTGEKNKYASGGIIEELKQYQRLLRIYPNEKTAERLIDLKLDSAHKITAISASEFVHLFPGQSDPTEEDVLKIYRKAEDIKQRTNLLFHNIRDLSSPFYKATLAANTRTDLEEKYAGIPGYTDLFGSLDYCQCEECRSILSPAAYFVDLMRLVNQYITIPNKQTIPEGLKITDRRPDLFQLPLDCEHTNNLVSYLQIVNDVLECKLSKDLGKDALQYLANTLYPFNAPYNKPLDQIREYLKHFKVSLADIYKQYKIDPQLISREYAGASIEQYKQVSIPDTTPDSLTKNYGMAITENNFGGLDNVKLFASQTGLQTVGNVKKLIYQNLSQSETGSDGILNQFFINKGNKTPLRLEVNTADPENEFLQIKNISLNSLDKLNRFIRLSTITNINYSELDYIIRQSQTKEINAEIFGTISKIMYICDKYNTDIQTICSFYTDMQTTGVGEGKIPEDLFDKIYNYPTTFYYSDPARKDEIYHPVYACNPTYTTPIVKWDPNDGLKSSSLNGLNANSRIRSRLVAALGISDDDLTILASRIINILGIANHEIPMSVPNMTLFYRFSKQASLLGQKMSDFLELLDLISMQQINTLDGFLSVADMIEWIKESGINIYEIKFIGTGEINKFVNVVYREEEIRTLLENLWAESQNWLVKPTSFIYNEIDEYKSLQIFNQLYANECITKEGVCLDKELTFLLASNLVQLLENSFITNLIDSGSSKQTYDELIKNKILSEGYVVEDFSSQTDLSFLFQGDSQKDEKTGQIRSLLLETNDLASIIAATRKTFISKNINADQAGKAFDDLAAHNLITNHGILTAAVTPDTNLSFLFPDEPKREQMIADVRKRCIDITYYVNSIVNIFINSNNLQTEGCLEELANLFNVSTSLITAVAKLSSVITGTGDIIVLLLTPFSPKGTIPENVLKLLRSISQLLFMCQKINLSSGEINSIFLQPTSYGIESIGKDFSFSPDHLQVFYRLKELQQVFNDNNQAFISFFSFQPDQNNLTEENEKIKMLSEITGWENEQLDYLIKTYLPDSKEANSVSDILWLKKAFDQAQLLGVDICFMTGLTVLSRLTADEQNWETYQSYAGLLFDILYAQTTNENREETYETVSAPVLESERDVLVDYMIWNLSKKFPFIKTPDDLYQFMLIDVEMSGITQTSYIKEAIGAVQLYMQRCRMNLEQGIEKMEVKDIWWEWMSGYRVWEANRKVFLYPENYIDPNLRNNKSPIFKDLKDELMQGDITDERVTSIYMSYFNKLDNLSNLKIAGSYYCEMSDPVWGVCKNLWLFGRTVASPYTYYYRRAIYRNDAIYWEPWKKIEVSIGNSFVTPIYAMNKLFLFWTESEQISGSTFENGNSVENNVYKATIEYTYYNFNEEWIQPQVLNKDIITYYYPNAGYINKIQSFISDMNIHLTQDNLFWQKPYPVSIPARDDIPEQIIVLFGNLPDLTKSGEKEPPYPPEGKTSSETEFYQMLYNSINRAVTARKNGLTGFVGMPAGGIINPNLRLEDTNIIIQNYNSIPGSPRPYCGYIDFSKSKLFVGETNNVLYDNYMGDVESTQVKFSNPTSNNIALLDAVKEKNIAVGMVKNIPGWFVYDNGDECFMVAPNDKNIKEIKDILKINNDLSSEEETDMLCTAYSDSGIKLQDLKFSFTRLNTVVTQQLSFILFAGGLDKLLTIQSQKTSELPFDRLKPTSKVISPPTDQLDFDGAYGIYFWETFFYIPFIIANTLSENQHFAAAQKWYHYIFNPMTKQETDSGNPNDRYWNFLPFWGQTPEKMEKILTDSKQIAVYNNDPFDPDAIAHLRSTTFQKAVVMKYIDNLIKWADHLFAQDTWEAIGEATMLYVMAKDLLGDKPQLSGTCKQQETATFQNILDKYGEDIPEFLIQLENLINPSGSDLLLSGKPYNDVNSYFCIGENKKFTEYWDTVEDRLFKIRHSMNIYGESRSLSLYEFPIDPMDLIKAFASSSGKNSSSKVFSAASVKIPEYRFSLIINQAKNVTSSLVQLGNSLLNALEKKDVEKLTLLKQTQEQHILNLTIRIKEAQLSQAKANLKALSENLKNAQNRYDHYAGLIATGLIPAETLHLQATILSNALSLAGSVMKLSSSIAHLVPNAGSPFAMTYGGREIGSSMNAVGSYFDILSGISGFVGNLSLTMAGYQRRESDWKFQQKTAGYDISNIKYQIEAAQLAQLIAEREINVAKKQIEQNKETESFYKTKFTNEDLYLWTINRLSTIYFQTYTLAYELALIAEKAYQFERNANEQFINFGYWDSLKKGLYSGEALQLSLSQLENAYMNTGKRCLEIKKSISLLQSNPAELINLKTKGICYFEFTEKLFDLDYPGHYRRQLKSVSITIPAIIGPYQNIKASLTQLTNKIIMKPDLNAVNYLLGDENASVPDSGVLRSNWKINQQIALSTGVNDFGLFQLNFGDERYLPFEGTGAVSTWKLEMDKASNPIDFESISDIIIQLNYEAVAGDENFKANIKKLPEISVFFGYQLLNLKEQYASEWFTFMNPETIDNEQSFCFGITENQFRKNLNNLTIPDVSLMLTLTDNTVFEGKLTAALTIINQTENYIFNKDNLIVNKQVSSGITDYFGQWLLVVKKSDIPEQLRNSRGFLDESKIENITVLISYNGEIKWTQIN